MTSLDPSLAHPLVAIDHPRLPVHLFYASEHNLFRRPIYRDYGLGKAYAHPLLAEKLYALTDRLAELTLKLVIFDIYRPLAVQQVMWDILPDERYVAHPSSGSNHNRATAVDCYLADEKGTPLVFPTEPDGYYAGAEQDLPRWIAYLDKAHHTYAGTPDEQPACRNRDLLRELMESVGLIALPEEWWHYELPDAETYPLIESL